MDYTEEQLKKIQMVRLIIGDSPGSPFYPLFEDEEIAAFLELNRWNVQKAARQAAISAALNFSQMVYRERTGDIEVWNNVSLQYMKALENLINDNPSYLNYGALRPYFGGVDAKRFAQIKCDPTIVKSNLTKINIEDCCPCYVKGWGILLVANADKLEGYYGCFNPKAC